MESERKKFYAGAKKLKPNLEGASFKVTTNEVVLDCEPTATFSDQSEVWVGINRFEGSQITMYAQTGYIRYRQDTHPRVIIKKRFAEVRAGPTEAPTDHWFDFGDYPAAGSHVYACDLDPATGDWKFSFDGVQWTHQAFDQWKRVAGGRADYNGEVGHRKTQMVGKDPERDRCEIDECKFRTTGNAPEGANLVAADVKSNDVDEWGAELIGAAPSNHLQIWDKKPPFAR